MTSENAAPAEMPGEMEVARAIATFRKHLYPDTKIDVLPSELAQAAAVMTLFAPILAEKERQLTSFRQYVAMHRDRALAAESSLAELRKQMLADEGQHREAVAAERERCALIAANETIHPLGEQIAAAILGEPHG